MPEEDFDYGDYDLEEEVTVVEPADALPYPDVAVHDDGTPVPQDKVLGFVNTFGRTPAEAIAIAKSWSVSRRFVGVGQCLATVRQYYAVPAGVGTAAESYWMSAHKRGVASGRDVPRGVPVYWTGGSSGAGHIAISVGGGVCLSTDWKEAGRIDYARIDDITSHWGLEFKGYTWEVNGHQVWAPAQPKDTVHLSNLKPGKRNNDVRKVKRHLWHHKIRGGYMPWSRYFGKGTKDAYAKWQRRLGYSGSAANGVPGKTSLEKLRFIVKP